MKIAETEISVFMPFYNEEDLCKRSVLEAREKLEDLGIDYELILVDDGSTDSTTEILERLAERKDRLRTVVHENNLGYGMALRSGFDSAQGDLVFYTDGDGQFDIAEIEKLLERIDDFDIVTGYRGSRQDSLSRIVTSNVFNSLARFLLPIEEQDIDCGFKLTRKDVLNDIDFETERTVDAELLARARNNGHRIEQVPVQHFQRDRGESEAEGLVGVRFTLILKSIEELFTIRRSLG